MANYDFGNLSPYELENLTRDLLQHRWGVFVESFAPGRDNGIDLRYARADSPSRIVQCKHYLRTGYAGLLSHLEGSELEKVRRLDPNRYCLVTSVPMTPARKAQIKRLFEPFIKELEDVMGPEDLNNMLGLWPDVEQQHFKLWLSSRAVLDLVLNNDVVTRTTSLLDDIERDAVLYVQNESFRRATDILHSDHVCVIAGPPGIGKSMLAKMLLLNHIKGGYAPVVVSSDIDEGDRLYSPGQQQVFYYDDFLGQAMMGEKLSKNEDARLGSFANRVRRAGNKRLILTTREYILRQAEQEYERLDFANLRLDLCLIDLADYTRKQRAEILYNHLYFSDLPASLKTAVRIDHGYRRIVDHPNYSPRVVQFVVKGAAPAGTTAEGLTDYFVETLNRPEVIWARAFENLDSLGQAVLLVLLSLPTRVRLTDLREAVDKYAQGVFNQALHPVAMRRTLKTLDGTFLYTDAQDDTFIVRVANPSVRDYLWGYLELNPDDLAKLIANVCFFDQVSVLLSASREVADKKGRIRLEPVSLPLSGQTTAVIEAAARTIEGKSVAVVIYRRDDGSTYLGTWHADYEERLSVLAQYAQRVDADAMMAWVIDRTDTVSGTWGEDTDADVVLRLLRAIEPARPLTSADASNLGRAALSFFANDLLHTERFDSYLDFRREWPDLVPAALHAEIQQTFERFSTDRLRDMIYEDGLHGTLAEEVEMLESCAERFAVELDVVTRSEVDEHLQELARREDQANDQAYEAYRDMRSRAAPDDDDQVIDRLFDSLDA